MQRSWIPALDWMRNYNREWLKGDLSAGLTVGVMLIPQGMAYAMLAGLPPIHGLYAVTLPLMVYALLGTSRQLAVGPVAMVSLLTATGVGAIAEVGTEAFLGLAVVLTLIVGVVQLLLGLFRLGFLVNLLSHPVISGFTSAAALIIGLSQLKHLLGVDLGRSHHIHEIIFAAVSRIGEINPWTFGIGIIGVGLIIGIKKVSKTVPGPLLAVVFGVLAVYLLGLQEQGVKIVGSVPSGLPGISFPTFTWEQIQALLPTALTISLVGFMESIAVAKAVQNKHKDYALVPNQELIALGAANLAGALVRSYPVTGGFSRTAVNDQAGAKTGLASLVSAGLIVLTLLFLTPLFYFLPQAILASVIMVAVFGLIDVAEVRHLWKVDRSDFWMLAATFVATLTLGIEQGIGVGVALSLAVHIYRSMRPHLAVLGRIPGTDIFRNVNRFKGVVEYPNALIVRFDGPLYFGNLTYFQAQLDALVAARGPELKTIVINAEGIASLDSSALHEMHNFVANQRKRGLAVRFAGLIGPARDSFKKAGLVDLIGQDNFFLHVAGALDGEAALRSGYVLQADV
ncbi:sulfate permease [Neolewinella lacunae]|uniref:Sulfate permease n=1 Tax=Neolewinella lacunae TaxID=1517758 RepID=A0A923TBS2_9BACT|nr:sulfate permease [Neolewinella lacunae]MBC6992922.1 sulfate permease [Neolewinella lacunae]MDN3633714.1 sulfate permease [Neolewinella lacunae]